MKPHEAAAVITGSAMVCTGLFVVVWNATHVNNWWDAKFVAGLIAGGLLLAYYKRIGQALKAVKDYIPVSIGKKAE